MTGQERAEGEEVMVAEGSSSLGAERRKNNWYLVIFWAVFILAALIFPGSPADGMVLCPFRAVTSWSCPGCGMTRSCTTFVRGEWWHSLEYHPLGWLLIVWLTGMALWRGLELIRGERLLEGLPWWVKRLGRLITVSVFVFIVLFGGVRLVLEIAGILTPV